MLWNPRRKEPNWGRQVSALLEVLDQKFQKKEQRNGDKQFLLDSSRDLKRHETLVLPSFQSLFA